MVPEIESSLHNNILFLAWRQDWPQCKTFSYNGRPVAPDKRVGNKNNNSIAPFGEKENHWTTWYLETLESVRKCSYVSHIFTPSRNVSVTSIVVPNKWIHVYEVRFTLHSFTNVWQLCKKKNWSLARSVLNQ